MKEGFKLGEESPHRHHAYAYHPHDYWFYVPSSVAGMMQFVERAWEGRSFATVYTRLPAFEYNYYGFYLQQLAPPEARLESIILPDALDTIPSWPSRLKLPDDDLSKMLLGSQKCGTPPLSAQQREDALRSPIFSWVHGWRFDYMEPNCTATVEASLRRVPSITWATSNYGSYNVRIGSKNEKIELRLDQLEPSLEAESKRSKKENSTSVAEQEGRRRDAATSTRGLSQRKQLGTDKLLEHSTYHFLDPMQVKDGRCNRVHLPGLEKGSVTNHSFCQGTVGGLEDELWLGGWHEPQVVHAILRPFRARSAFVDIGANAGLLSVVALSGGYTDVLSFEPQPGCADALRYMHSQNGAPSRWRIFNYGVSHTPQVISVPAASCGMNWQWVPPNSARRSWKAHTATVSQIVGALDDDAGPAFFKIDVDGAEVSVVEGLLDVLPLTGPSTSVPESLPLSARRAGQHRLTHLPELYIEVDVVDWNKFNNTHIGVGLAVFEALGAHYEDVYFFSSMAGACEGGLGDADRNLTEPFLYVSENHPPPSIRRWYGKGLPQHILRVLDYNALLRRCVMQRRQLNLWFAR